MQQLHGSGKTAVLVERIINKLVKEKINVDQLLVVTFTNAAASEMKQRILDAIYQKLEENPEDSQMQKQTVLMGKANVCTIHSFCLEVIRNHFYELGIAPNFRIGEQTEIEIIKQEVLEDIFEKYYEEENEEFLMLIHTYTGYRGDEPLKELILKIYRYIQSSPFPEEWLEQAVKEFDLKDTLEQDFSKTKWGAILLEDFEEELESCKIELKSVQATLRKYPELQKFLFTINQDIDKIEELEKITSWEELYEKANQFKFDTWPREKIVMEQKEIAKQKRDEVKKRFNKIRDKILLYNSKQANEDMNQMYPILVALKNMVLEFQAEFKKAKGEKNIIDFNDIEHFALTLLVKKDEEQHKIPTDIAKKYQEQFVEIAIDEYQDSNLVQEYILSTISRGNNIFMVGDVKQSIYKFRQARPELFIQKYETYQLKEEKKEEEDLKIQLFKNFRSRENILEITNLIFENIMSKELGDITYDQKEFLNLGANYQEPEQEIEYAGKTELHIINLKQQEEQEKKDEAEEEIERVEDAILEARLVASKIQELVASNYQVYDRKLGYRRITYKDIVVLLRATSVLAPIYEKEISNLEIPVFSDTGSQYLDTIEIQTIISLLKVIDNPRQDIPLVSVLRSNIGGFDDNELIQIKLEASKEKTKCFYDCLKIAKESINVEVQNKIDQFFKQLEIWRAKQEYLPLDELIWQIYLDTGYYHYVSLMPNGELRQANLKMLFEKAKQYEKASFKGLFNFINFLDKLKSSNSDMDSAKLIGENENVVRIMSIHKSKGLEFPVVILAGTGKKFNLQDLNETILLHQDIGLGPKYINYERRIEYNTLAKEAISYQTKIETLSEEMRVLYVALTRAKEKLIITGLSKDIQKELEQKEERLRMYEGKTISKSILKKYKSYLDWIELVYLKNQDKIGELVTLQIHQKEDWIKSVRQQEKEEITIKYDNKQESKEKEEIQKKLNWSYPNLLATMLPTKLSVTQIKEKASNIQNSADTQKKKQKDTLVKPKFLQEEVQISNAEKGTLIHLCMQKMNPKQNYDAKKIQEMIQKLVTNKRITTKEAQQIDLRKLIQYTQSELWKSLNKAKEIYQEQPFYCKIPAKEIYQEEIKENILVQGVIDLYYIDEEDNLILVDYKTDHIKQSEEELIDKYQTQLTIYKDALEEALQRKVDDVFIYSVELGRNIRLFT